MFGDWTWLILIGVWLVLALFVFPRLGIST